jgi:hypothetical protein
MQKITFILALNLALSGLACAAGVCSKAHAQWSATESRAEINHFFSGGISPPQQTTLDFDCDNASFRISSGTTTGTCHPLASGGGATCTISGNIVAQVTCPAGCSVAIGTGSCTRAR